MYRIERKFLVDCTSKDNALRILKLNKVLITESFPTRYINNIYFDTENLQCYRDNIDGIDKRFKIRIRWYGELLKPHNAKLEIKYKKGLAGFKHSYSLPFSISGKLPNFNEIKNAIAYSNIPSSLKVILREFRPSLVNRYQRNYFVTSDQCLRVTFDSDLQYFSSNSFLRNYMKSFSLSKDYIIELKIPSENLSNGSEFSNSLPFRMTKNSKYIQGLNLLMTR